MTARSAVAKKTTARKTRSATAVVRPPEVEAEIRKALELRKSSWRESAATFRVETVVHLARHLKGLEDADLLGDLLEKRIFREATPVIKANSKTLSFDDRSDVLREVYKRITEAVMNGSPQVPDFLEARFGLKVKQWTIDTVRKVVRQTDGLIPLVPAHELQRELVAWSDEDADRRDELFGNRCSTVTAEVLAKVPIRVQQAFLQHVYEGIPIESERIGALSIANIHNVSGRAVRLWFAQIRDAVKEKLRSNHHEYE